MITGYYEDGTYGTLIPWLTGRRPCVHLSTHIGVEYELALRGFSGQSYVVEASTNLVKWTAITTNVATLGRFILHDAEGTNFSHRFYQAKVANHPN